LDPANPLDSQAVLLDNRSGTPVGWIPGYMCEYVHDHLDVGSRIEVTVVQANSPDVPRHLQLLCRMLVQPTAH
jgi:hypothetical protein